MLGAPKNSDNTTIKNANCVTVLDLETSEWRSVNPKGDITYSVLSREGHSACLFKGNQIMVFGGLNDNFALNDTAVLTVQPNDRNFHF